MKKHIIAFACWLLRLMGVKATAGVEWSALASQLKDENDQAKALLKTETTYGIDPGQPKTAEPNTIDCAVCGCMVRKWKAIRGAGIIKDKNSWGTPYIQPIFSAMRFEPVLEQYIYYPYYCKRCAPKKKK